MAWAIVYSEEFELWLQELDDDAAKSVVRLLGILEEFGPALGRPYVDTIKGSSIPNLKELRTQNRHHVLRTFFVFDPDRSAVILIGGDKAGDKRFYTKLIRQAEEIYADYQKRYKYGKKGV